MQGFVINGIKTQKAHEKKKRTKKSSLDMENFTKPSSTLYLALFRIPPKIPCRYYLDLQQMFCTFSFGCIFNVLDGF